MRSQHKSQHPNRIRKLRQERDLSQREVEAATGIDQSKMSRLEQQKQKLDMEDALKLADFFGVDVTEVFGTDPPREDVLLAEIRALRDEIRSYQRTTDERLTALESKFVRRKNGEISGVK